MTPDDDDELHDDELLLDHDVGCTVCDGEGWGDCWAGLECLDPVHVSDDWCRCPACGGTGRAGDQRVW